MQSHLKPRVKPWLWLPSKVAHDIAPLAMKAVTLPLTNSSPTWRPLDWKGLKFQNPLGIAGGVDKNAQALESWWKLGIGFAEVGTITPEPQKANPGVIMKRSVSHQALWNKMGFPNKGANFLANRLQKISRPFPTPLFINIGKNRWTPNETAFNDYLKCMHLLVEFADAFVINISSPNTKGLRDLQQEDGLKKLLEPIANFKTDKNGPPTLLKISPDMNEEQLSAVIKVGLEFELDGWIISNTTQSRLDHIAFPVEGGMSGAPLSSLSCQTLEKVISLLGDKRKGQLIVSAGGVTSEKDVLNRLDLGADLIQTYSGVVFGGPFFFKNCLKVLSQKK